MAIIQVEPDSQEWLDLRHRDLTASDVAVFFDPKSFKTELGLYYEKRAEHPPQQVKYGDDNYVRMQAGKFLEPFIAAVFEEETGIKIEPFNGYVRSDEVDRYACTPDYYYPTLADGTILDIVRGNHTAPITADDGPGLAELKIANTMSWNNNYTDNEPPLKYLVQLQEQLDVVKYNWGMIVTLVDCDAIDIAVYRRDPEACAAIRQRVKEFWHKVDNGIEPDISDRVQDSQLMKQIYPDLQEEIVDLSDNMDLFNACEAYGEAHLEYKGADSHKVQNSNIVAQIVKNNAMTHCGIYQIKRSVSEVKELFKIEILETGEITTYLFKNMDENNPNYEVAMDMKEKGNKTRTVRPFKYHYVAGGEKLSITIKERKDL